MADGVPEVIEQQGDHVLAHAQPDQNALHSYAGGCSGEGVGGYLPASGAQPVSEIGQRVAGVFAVAYTAGHRRDAGGRNAVTQELGRARLYNLRGEVLADRIRRVVDAFVALKAETQKVVVLGDDLAGRAGEVDLKDRHVAAEVVDVEHQVVGKLLAVSPEDPADAQRSQAELVPRGADRLDPGQPEVEDHVRCAERREERAAGPVYVNVDVEAGFCLQLVPRL